MLEQNKIIQGDCIERMKELPDNSVDAIITDPPYGLEFMGKDWDKFKEGKNIAGGTTGEGTPFGRSKAMPSFYQLTNKSMNNFQEFNFKWASECFRILKPGGHLLAFSGTRTYHRMVCAIEDAGFEIRDMIEWVYGSGFPKSLNIGKAVDKLQGNERVKGELKFKGGTQLGVINDDGWKPKDVYEDKGNTEWEGWGTALKPAHEPIVLARKPLSEKTVAENVLKWGTGGINIDESRVEAQGKDLDKLNSEWDREWNTDYSDYADKIGGRAGFKMDKSKKENAGLTGRFPANLIHDNSEEVLKEFEKAGNCGAFAPVKSGQKGFGGVIYGKYETGGDDGKTFYEDGLGTPARFFKTCEFTEEDYPPFFYTAKASKRERDYGCDNLPLKEEIYPGANTFDENGNRLRSDGSIIPPLKARNNHPTVKPIKLMEYLIKLVTPKNGIVLDPFLGSGTTALACINLNRQFIGIEKEEDYIKIAQTRINNTIKIKEIDVSSLENDESPSSPKKTFEELSDDLDSNYVYDGEVGGKRSPLPSSPEDRRLGNSKKEGGRG